MNEMLIRRQLRPLETDGQSFTGTSALPAGFFRQPIREGEPVISRLDGLRKVGKNIGDTSLFRVLRGCLGRQIKRMPFGTRCPFSE